MGEGQSKEGEIQNPQNVNIQPPNTFQANTNNPSNNPPKRRPPPQRGSVNPAVHTASNENPPPIQKTSPIIQNSISQEKTSKKDSQESKKHKIKKKVSHKLDRRRKKDSAGLPGDLQPRAPPNAIHRQISRNTLAGFSERRNKILSNDTQALNRSSGHEQLLKSIRNSNSDDEEIQPRNRRSYLAPPKPQPVFHPEDQPQSESKTETHTTTDRKSSGESIGAYVSTQSSYDQTADDSDDDDDFGSWNDDDDDDDDDDDEKSPTGGYVSHPAPKKVEKKEKKQITGGYATNQPAGGYNMNQPAGGYNTNPNPPKKKPIASGGYGGTIEDSDDSDDNFGSDSEEDDDEDHFSTKNFSEVFQYLSTLNNDDLIKVGKEIDEKMKGKFVPCLLSTLNDHRDEKRALGEDSDGEVETDHNTNQNNNIPNPNDPVSIHCDWNKNFQQYLDNLKVAGHIQEQRMNSFIGISNLALDFIHAAKIYGRIIISEAETPIEYKTIQPMKIGGIAGGDKYIVNNILFKFAVDNHGLFDNDEAAMKIAGHDLKGLIGYFNLSIEDLHFPLMALVDYLGFRLIAMSLLPINKNTIVYGSSDGGITMYNTNPTLAEKMKLSAKLLNLKSHKAGRTKGNEIVIHSAADLEGHEVGGQFYLLDFSRAFPPTAYNPKARNGNLYQLFRVEFLNKYSKPLCSDTYSGFTSLHDPQPDIDDINAAHNYLLNIVIYKCAIQLDGRILDKGSPVNLKEVLHEAGINLRYMGLIRIHVKKNEDMRRILLIEMVARVIKHQLRSVLRQKLKETKVFLEHSCREAVVDRLNLIFGNSVESDAYFDGAIKTHLLRNYDKALSPEEDAQPLKNLLRAHLFALFGAVLKISSLQFLRNSVLEFTDPDPTKKPFEVRKPIHLSDLEGIGVQVRHMNIVALALGYVLKNQARELQKEGSSHSGRLCKLAIEQFNVALSDNPGDKRVLRELADTSLIMKDKSTAEKYYLKALNADQRDVNTMFKYAVFLEDCDRFKEAEDYYLRTLELDPNLDHCLQRYGHFLETQGHPDEAEEFFIRASKIRSQNATHSDVSQTPRQMVYFL